MMGMKKVPVILVVCVLLFSSLDVLADNSNNAVGPAECCYSYRAARLPKVGVVSFQRTHIHCPTDGVVFTMKNGMKVCTDPSQAWVQNIITHVESTKQ